MSRKSRQLPKKFCKKFSIFAKFPKLPLKIRATGLGCLTHGEKFPNINALVSLSLSDNLINSTDDLFTNLNHSLAKMVLLWFSCSRDCLTTKLKAFWVQSKLNTAQTNLPKRITEFWVEWIFQVRCGNEAYYRLAVRFQRQDSVIVFETNNNISKAI